mmetsp:Transcript_1282/g.4748  ORF Transcript_1282/g.4748 Transcript_1282/m.4748 type:complete len:233 (+) Transcript_1282:853-1551(+)
MCVRCSSPGAYRVSVGTSAHVYARPVRRSTASRKAQVAAHEGAPALPELASHFVPLKTRGVRAATAPRTACASARAKPPNAAAERKKARNASPAPPPRSKAERVCGTPATAANGASSFRRSISNSTACSYSTCSSTPLSPAAMRSSHCSFVSTFRTRYTGGSSCSRSTSAPSFQSLSLSGRNCVGGAAVEAATKQRSRRRARGLAPTAPNCRLAHACMGVYRVGRTVNETQF